MKNVFLAKIGLCMTMLGSATAAQASDATAATTNTINTINTINSGQETPPTASSANSFAVDEKGWKFSGHAFVGFGVQKNQLASVFPPEGSAEGTHLLSRKTQFILKATRPGVMSGVLDAQYDMRPLSPNVGRVNQFNLAFDLADNLKMRVGKQRVLWGRGFVYVPTDFINPPLDPSGLDLAKVGVPGVSFDYVTSGYSLTAMLRSEKKGVDSVGVKFSPGWKSGLDLDFIAYHAPSIGNAFGASFALDASQLLHPNLDGLVVFGGAARHTRSRYPAMQAAVFSDPIKTPYVLAAGAGKEGRYNSLLLGSSYQATGNWLFLGEYYHIGDAYSQQQFGGIMHALGDKGSLRRNLHLDWLNHLSFGRNQRNYMNISISKGALTEGESRFTDTFSIEVASLRSFEDQSGINSLSMISNYFDRTEVSIRSIFPYGRANTEFGSAPYKWYVELGLKIGF